MNGSPERLSGTDIELQLCATSDAPPPEEVNRLHDALRRAYRVTSAQPVVVLIAWSAAGRSWRIRSASQRIAAAAFFSRTREMVEKLASVGLLVEASELPLDSPPAGNPLPPKS